VKNLGGTEVQLLGIGEGRFFEDLHFNCNWIYRSGVQKFNFSLIYWRPVQVLMTNGLNPGEASSPKWPICWIPKAIEKASRTYIQVRLSNLVFLPSHSYRNTKAATNNNNPLSN